MNAKPFKVGDLATQLGVVPNTIRNYCKRYAPYLSAGANPPAGRERLFTTRDLNVLTYINVAVNEGVQHDELTVQLAAKTFNDGEADVVVGMVEVMPAKVAPSPQEGQGDALAVHAALSTMQAQINAIQRTQTTLLRAAVLWGALWGAIGALTFAGFVVWVLWLLT